MAGVPFQGSWFQRDYTEAGKLLWFWSHEARITASSTSHAKHASLLTPASNLWDLDNSCTLPNRCTVVWFPSWCIVDIPVEWFFFFELRRANRQKLDTLPRYAPSWALGSCMVQLRTWSWSIGREYITVLSSGFYVDESRDRAESKIGRRRYLSFGPYSDVLVEVYITLII